jgi:hypothetical protein
MLNSKSERKSYLVAGLHNRGGDSDGDGDNDGLL